MSLRTTSFHDCVFNLSICGFNSNPSPSANVILSVASKRCATGLCPYNPTPHTIEASLGTRVSLQTLSYPSPVKPRLKNMLRLPLHPPAASPGSWDSAARAAPRGTRPSPCYQRQGKLGPPCCGTDRRGRERQAGDERGRRSGNNGSGHSLHRSGALRRGQTYLISPHISCQGAFPHLCRGALCLHQPTCTVRQRLLTDREMEGVIFVARYLRGHGAEVHRADVVV